MGAGVVITVDLTVPVPKNRMGAMVELSVVVTLDGQDIVKHSVNVPRLSRELQELVAQGIKSHLELVSRAADYDDKVKTLEPLMPRECPEPRRPIKAPRGRGTVPDRYSATSPPSYRHLVYPSRIYSEPVPRQE